MSTTSALVDGRIRLDIDIADLIGGVPAEHRSDLMQRIACEDAVIRHVMDQVLTGMTANASSGSSRIDWQPDDGYPSALETAREAMLRLSEKATQGYLERLRAVFRHHRRSETRRLGESRDLERKLWSENADLRRQLADVASSRDHWRQLANEMVAEKAAGA